MHNSRTSLAASTVSEYTLRMLERRHGAGLAADVANDLEGNAAFERLLPSQVHRARSPTAEQTQDLEVGNHRSCVQRGGGLRRRRCSQ
jgi:hypothetical protein